MSKLTKCDKPVGFRRDRGNGNKVCIKKHQRGAAQNNKNGCTKKRRKNQQDDRGPKNIKSVGF